MLTGKYLVSPFAISFTSFFLPCVPFPLLFLIRSLSIHYSTRMCNSRFSQTNQYSPLLCCRTSPTLDHLIFSIAQTTSQAAFCVARRSPHQITESHSGRSISRLSDHTPSNHVIISATRLYSSPPQYYSASVYQMLYLLSSTYFLCPSTYRQTAFHDSLFYCSKIFILSCAVFN